MSVADTLAQAIAGLSMPSEADYPFEVIVWPQQTATEELSLDKLRHLTGHASDTPVQTVDLDQLFRPVVQEQDWHNDSDRAEVKRFQSLIATLKATLSNIRVYRVGTVEIDVYILGATAEGTIAGLSTKVVET